MSGVSEQDLCQGYQNDQMPESTSSMLSCIAGDASLALAHDMICSAVEEESIHMEANRESLKRKLMLRRTLPELVDQGIYPPLNVPPAFADRQRHLQRAQAGDRLRQKLKERPDRECLVQHHILEDTSLLVDRSLQDKQRLLKRSRLQSDLSGRLASRPGPLELVTKNILQTDPQLKDGLMEGKIPFTKTTEVDDPVRRLLHPDLYQADGEEYGVGIGIDESINALDFSALISTSDDSLPESICLTPTEGTAEQATLVPSSAPSPPASFSHMSPKLSVTPNIPPAPDITPLLQGGRKFQFVNSPLPPAPVFTFTKNLQPLPVQSTVSIGGDAAGSLDAAGSFGTLGSGSKRITKKVKSKNMMKSKVIKFHEYKGPPSSVKLSTKIRAEPVREQPVSASTAYSVLLEQQQLFLQWQLEFQQKALLSRQQSESGQLTSGRVTTPPTITAHTSHSASSMAEAAQPRSIGTPGVFSFKSVPVSASSSFMKPVMRLDEMKVADLRSECKRLSLPSNGSKPQLIERLTPHIMKINFNAGHAREPVSTFRNSDSSLSGSSEVTSPVPASLETSFSGSQFGILPSQNPIVPVSMDIVPARPSSIVPMEIDQNTSQSVGGFICPQPSAAIILVRSTPQFAQPPETRSQALDNKTIKDQNRSQILGARKSQLSSDNFNSSGTGSSISVAQPVMLVACPVGGPELHKADEQKLSFATNLTTQPVQTVHASRPNSGNISSEELVVRQQHLIATLEQSLQEYQRKLLWTQQKALLQQIQLSSLAHDNLTSASNMMGENRNPAVADGQMLNAFLQKDSVVTTVQSSNGLCNQMLFTVAPTRGSAQTPCKLSTNANGSVANVPGQLPPYRPLLRSATNPDLPVSTSVSSDTCSTGKGDSYLNSSVVSTSMAAPSLFSHLNGTTMDDIMDLLSKRGELLLPSNSNEGNVLMLNKELYEADNANLSDLDNKPMFFLPETGSGDAGQQLGRAAFTSVNGMLPFSKEVFMTSNANSTCFNAAPKMDSQIAEPQMVRRDGPYGSCDVDVLNSLLPLSSLNNMEWSDLELDLMNSHMDVHHTPLGNSEKATKTFDFDINDADWLTENSGTEAAPVYPFGAIPTLPFVIEDYLPMPRTTTDALDLFSYDEADPFMTSDLSTMTFEKLVDVQTSKT